MMVKKQTILGFNFKSKNILCILLFFFVFKLYNLNFVFLKIGIFFTALYCTQYLSLS